VGVEKDPDGTFEVLVRDHVIGTGISVFLDTRRCPMCMARIRPESPPHRKWCSRACSHRGYRAEMRGDELPLALLHKMGVRLREPLIRRLRHLREENLISYVGVEPARWARMNLRFPDVPLGCRQAGSCVCGLNPSGPCVVPVKED
jgi:hypothetical protein